MVVCQTEEKRIGFLFFNMLLTNTYIIDIINNFKMTTGKHLKIHPFLNSFFS
jgi:hypothetical protein